MKGKKVLYFDSETTGTKPKENGMCQIAFIVEVNGNVIEEKNFYVRPFEGQIISKEALEINGLTIEKIREFPLPQVVHGEILKMLNRYIDRYNKDDKFYPAGYNVRFDLDFLVEFFERNNDKYFGSFVNWRMIDPLPILYWLDYHGKISLENYKLETVCKYFGIKIEAHEALSDVNATRELIKKVDNFVFGKELKNETFVQ